MSPIDGGSAFPASVGQTLPGMSLRDYFAAAALTGFLQRGAITDMDLLAEKAWGAADWMLAERVKAKP